MPTIALSDLRTQRNLYRRPIHLRDLTYLASGASAKRLAAIDKEAKSAMLGDAASFPLPQARALAAGFDLGDDFRAPARFETPALLVGGSMDFHTPYSEQREAGAQFTRANWLTVENGTHDLLSDDSAVAAPLARFFRGEKVETGTIRVPEIELY
jgi:pimeloyl-ACP methyl ester carboxylesterase